MSSHHTNLPITREVLGESACTAYADQLKKLTKPHSGNTIHTIITKQSLDLLRKLCKDLSFV